MSNASGTGPNDPSSRLTPRASGTPGYEDSDYGDCNAAGRDGIEDVRPARDAAALGKHGPIVESDQDAQPVDPALIAGGDDLVGVANDMTTGANNKGATSDGERA